METKLSIIHEAELWARSLWEDSLGRWANRSGQDKRYRIDVVRPAINDILGRSFPDGALNIVEFGCGDGSLLEDGVVINRIRNNGRYLGIDIASDLISRARDTFGSNRIAFEVAGLHEPRLQKVVARHGGEWNAAISVFAIQEIPGLPAVLRAMAVLLPVNTRVVFLTVHPGFGCWLRECGAMGIIDTLGDDPEEVVRLSADRPWRWTGTYPIVDEPLNPFPLPYFHRTLDDYRVMFGEAGLDITGIVPLPGKDDLRRLTERGSSPFAPFETNVYWPEIGRAPSSVAILATVRNRTR